MLNFRSPFQLIIIFPLTLPCSLSGQASDGQAPDMESQSLWGLIQEGGWAMWPLGLCSLAMLFFIFYGWKESQTKKFIPQSTLKKVRSQLEAREISKATEMLEEQPSVLSKTMILAMTKARPEMQDANKEKIESSLVEALEGEENSVGQWINYLNVVAAVAPMIGLLGTVSGMIGAFSTIAQGGMGRPELLAGDIGEALITTATGLVIGIPAMIAYFVLRNRLSNLMLATKQTASQLIDALAGDFKIENKS